MTGRRATLLRLLALQGSWNYERMQGIGMAWASLPLLAPLRERDPVRHAEAVGRATAFFNANPFVAGVAVGAAAREEAEGAPGDLVARLRTALCGPLGALGDQLFWMGTVPGLAATGLLTVALGLGWWGPLLVVGLHSGFRWVVGAWALDLGLTYGRRVGAAIEGSWLGRGIEWAGRGSALLLGLAIPVAVAWLLEPVPATRRWLAVALALALYRLIGRLDGRITPAALTLIAMGLVLLWHWSTA